MNFYKTVESQNKMNNRKKRECSRKIEDIMIMDFREFIVLALCREEFLHALVWSNKTSDLTDEV